jgi:hypothetical protein
MAASFSDAARLGAVAGFAVLKFTGTFRMALRAARGR